MRVCAGDATSTLTQRSDPARMGPRWRCPGRGAGRVRHGLTRELIRLQALGLLRRVGRGTPKRYQVVPLAEIEEAVRRYELRGKRRKRRRSMAARIEELRDYKHGDYSEWYRVHRRVLELTDYVSKQISRMAFWHAAPKDELARTAQDLADLQEALDLAFECLKMRADDDALLAKIEKLCATSGRKGAELETARALARRLQTQYEQRVGL